MTPHAANEDNLHVSPPLLYLLHDSVVLNKGESIRFTTQRQCVTRVLGSRGGKRTDPYLNTIGTEAKGTFRRRPGVPMQRSCGRGTCSYTTALTFLHIALCVWMHYALFIGGNTGKL
ncbi:hypothetical protein DPEC_G00235680 [Dallia pectoralis]|uniref:Uncharacterized protein n=1 Tax=Dallia pectoralis TaxID=75939 RepID=A0ACC2FYB7_DALPE|nr:hypothetical protein DPEC_G00235680 [Dallia pectoralis]